MSEKVWVVNHTGILKGTTLSVQIFEDGQTGIMLSDLMEALTGKRTLSLYQIVSTESLKPYLKSDFHHTKNREFTIPGEPRHYKALLTPGLVELGVALARANEAGVLKTVRLKRAARAVGLMMAQFAAEGMEAAIYDSLGVRRLGSDPEPPMVPEPSTLIEVQLAQLALEQKQAAIELARAETELERERCRREKAAAAEAEEAYTRHVRECTRRGKEIRDTFLWLQGPGDPWLTKDQITKLNMICLRAKIGLPDDFDFFADLEGWEKRWNRK